MRSFWFDPYLWIHLAGLAALPIFLEICLVGFAIGDPLLPVWLEVLLVGVVGAAPVLWMQWQRPFYIFSVMAVAVKPEQLTDDQRRLLVLFKSQRNRVLAAVVPVFLVFLLWKIYAIAPIAAPGVSFLPKWRFFGLLLAAGAFLGSNLFMQVPISVASVMLTTESAFAATPPYPLESIRRSFTLVGLRVNRFLPPLRPDVKLALVETVPLTATQATPPPSQASPGNDPLASDLWVESETPVVTASATDSDAVTSVASDEATGSNADKLASEQIDS
ncbi:low-complexity tail membrane protein [Leptolyngbya sp. FACHB-321]|uniref:low-complexity tail membrane protein n=1 Tax=Leptolyngbya sp. FACHB-321 TaxID=2692807 RepID=UPI001686FB60|nr:low-complexity tail membrane protein [Leptolyngbya sp. FACHB-321]MBD2038100.1 low-complexity tail membrane protein [Leptolyngbya sp. FACHB-321]